MRSRLVPLFVFIASVTVAYADSWPWPTEKDYFSANGRFVAHVTPPKYLQKDEPLLEVSVIRAIERVPLWQHKMGNLKAPVEVYVSDDGECVISINEHGRVGYGDHVLAFYTKKGKIKNYSLEEILDLPAPPTKSQIEQMRRLLGDARNLDKEELRRLREVLTRWQTPYQLIPHSVSSRWWDSHSIKFFDNYAGKLYFSIWLHVLERWMAWNPADGEEVEVDEKMVENWNRKARLWALNQIERGTDYYHAPYEFLGKLKNPEDRPLIEKLLSDEDFGGYARSSQTEVGQDGRRICHLTRYNVSSAKRLLAEQLVAKWDGKPTDRQGLPHPPLYHLGRVEGVVTLPETDDPNKATLWIYLVSSTVPKDQWHRKPPVQRLAASFSDYSLRDFDLDYTREFPFGITGVSPGEYWLKAVLDKTKPFSKQSDRVYLPQQGDYQSIDSPIITVKPAETVKDITIDCTEKVTGRLD